MSLSSCRVASAFLVWLVFFQQCSFSKAFIIAGTGRVSFHAIKHNASWMLLQVATSSGVFSSSFFPETSGPPIWTKSSTPWATL